MKNLLVNLINQFDIYSSIMTPINTAKLFYHLCSDAELHFLTAASLLQLKLNIIKSDIKIETSIIHYIDVPPVRFVEAGCIWLGRMLPPGFPRSSEPEGDHVQRLARHISMDSGAFLLTYSLMLSLMTSLLASLLASRVGSGQTASFLLHCPLCLHGGKEA